MNLNTVLAYKIFNNMESSDFQNSQDYDKILLESFCVIFEDLNKKYIESLKYNNKNTFENFCDIQLLEHHDDIDITKYSDIALEDGILKHTLIGYEKVSRKISEPYRNILIKILEKIRKDPEKKSQKNREKLLKIVDDIMVSNEFFFFLGPLLGAITLIHLEENTGFSERVKVVKKLEENLRKVEKKIDECDKKDGESKNKYQLMRVKNKLEHKIVELKYFKPYGKKK